MANNLKYEEIDDGIPAQVLWHGMEALLNDDQISRFLIDGTNEGLARPEMDDGNHDTEWWRYHDKMLCELLNSLILEIRQLRKS